MFSAIILIYQFFLTKIKFPRPPFLLSIPFVTAIASAITMILKMILIRVCHVINDLFSKIKENLLWLFKNIKLSI